MSGDRQLSIREAATIQFASKYSNVIVQLAVSMVLARLLTPAEYGTMAIVSVFASFFSLLSDMGLIAGVVQHKELSDDDVSGLFLFSVVAAGVLALLFALLSVPVSLIYGDALLRPLFFAASAGVFFSTLNSVPNGVMLREKRFASIGLRLVVVNALTGIGAIALAFLGAGAFALVVQSVASSAFVFAWNFSASGVRLRRVSVLGPLREVIGFSGYQTAHGFVNYFSRNMDNLLVGLAFGNAMLGLYSKAYGLSTYPITMFTSVVASVLHPYLSDWRDEPGRFLGTSSALRMRCSPWGSW